MHSPNDLNKCFLPKVFSSVTPSAMLVQIVEAMDLLQLVYAARKADLELRSINEPIDKSETPRCLDRQMLT